MGRFNRRVETPKSMVVNRAGGRAYEQSPELELVSLLLSSFCQEQYYCSSDEQVSRVRTLVEDVDTSFAMKAALYARHEVGMRSITHVLAAAIADKEKGPVSTPVGGIPIPSPVPAFIDKVVRRPDDALEIAKLYMDTHDGKLSAGLKKGLGRAIAKFSAYQLGKYKGEGSELKMVDLINLVHPRRESGSGGTVSVPLAEAAAAGITVIGDEPVSMTPVGALIHGVLPSPDTWEVRLTRAGEEAKRTGQNVDVLKKEVWRDLLLREKLGYMALLRNVRNIIQADADLVPDLCEQLIDGEAIRKSLVMPFRFMSAMRAVDEYWQANKSGNAGVYYIVQGAISIAAERALAHVPEFPGKTVVVLDTSGSMRSGGCGDSSPMEVGSMFCASMIKRNRCDAVLFSDDADYVTVDPTAGVLAIQKKLIENVVPAGTNFHAIFPVFTEKYDRVIILSDMQGWMDGTNHPDALRWLCGAKATPTKEFYDYNKKFAADPWVYSWDLAGYGDAMFPENKIIAISGFSDRAFELINAFESGRETLLKKIAGFEM